MTSMLAIAPVQPHQTAALEEMCDLESLLCEYGTGTGKTLIVVEMCKILVEVGEVPILVAVPNALLEQTEEEFRIWAGDAWVERNLRVLDSTYTLYRRREVLKRGRDNVILISHESFSAKEVREGIKYRVWSASFVDEASRFRNYSKRTMTLKTLGQRSKTRYAFTGNLLVNTPADIFYVMTYLNPDIFGTQNRTTFMHEYCLMGGYMGNQPIDIRPDRLAQLQAIMDANRIRCELRDIRKLPERELSVRYVDMHKDQRKAYVQMRDELKLEIERLGESDFNSRVRTYATRLQRLQEIAAGFARNLDKEVVFFPSPKTNELVELLQDEPEKPTIVWYWWVPERDRIATELKKRKIDFVIFGQPGARAAFRSGKVNVFLAQNAKGGYGLNLPNCTRMIYHSLPWDMDVYLQSQERNVRLNTPVEAFLEIIHILARNTVDGYVRGKLLDKAGVSAKLSKSQALELLRGS